MFDADRRLLSVTPPGGPELSLNWDGNFTISGQAMAFDHEQPQPQITFDSAKTAAGNGVAQPFYSKRNDQMNQQSIEKDTLRTTIDSVAAAFSRLKGIREGPASSSSGRQDPVR